MTRRIMFAAFLCMLTAGIVLGGLNHGDSAVASADAAASVEAPALGVCDSQFVRNVRIKDLGRKDFEVTWEFAPPDPCLQATNFVVEVRAKRNVGGSILGRKNFTVGTGERRVIANFTSILGMDQVDATVTATITLKPFSSGNLNL